MFYSIGEVSDKTGIAISTLRYYDREGMFPDMKRSSGGIRVFSDQEMDILRIVECLKTSGMSIREIKEFLCWCQEGDASLQKRSEMFHKRLESVQKQMDELQNTMNILKYKCWYYDTAVAGGTEDTVRNLPESEIPEDLRKYKV